MPRGSFSRTVARAAASGGSRSYRARRPHAWYALLIVIVLGGAFLVGYSRNENLHPKSTAVGPSSSADWNVAFGIDICGTMKPDLPVSTNYSSVGIRTIGNGLINIDPAVSSTPKDFDGKNATLGNFVLNYSGLTLTTAALKFPGTGEKTWANGDVCTGPLKGKGTLVTKVWSSPTAQGKLYKGSPLLVRFNDNQMITVAFVPKGASIPEPTSKSQLASA